jgi:hypothetical protein
MEKVVVEEIHFDPVPKDQEPARPYEHRDWRKDSKNAQSFWSGDWRKRYTEGASKFNEQAKVRYLEVLSKTGRTGQACTAVDICYQTLANHRKADPVFAAAEEQALEHYRDYIMGKVEEFATVGFKEPVYNKDGDHIGDKRVIFPALLQMEAKRVQPGYKDKTEVDMNVSGGSVLVVPPTMSQEEWMKLFAPKQAPDSSDA